MKNPQPPNEKRLKSKESLYFPSVQGDKWKTLDPDIRWELSDIINHIFPKEYQERSNEYAQKLMVFLLKNPGGIDKKMLSDFVADKLSDHFLPNWSACSTIRPSCGEGLATFSRRP